MKPVRLAAAAVIAASVLVPLRAESDTPQRPRDESRRAVMTKQKQQVVDLLKSLETGALGPAEVLSPSGFVQHNPDLAETGYAAVLAGMPEETAPGLSGRRLRRRPQGSRIPGDPLGCDHAAHSLLPI